MSRSAFFSSKLVRPLRTTDGKKKQNKNQRLCLWVVSSGATLTYYYTFNPCSVGLHPLLILHFLHILIRPLHSGSYLEHVLKNQDTEHSPLVPILDVSIYWSIHSGSTKIQICVFCLNIIYFSFVFISSGEVPSGYGNIFRTPDSQLSVFRSPTPFHYFRSIAHRKTDFIFFNFEGFLRVSLLSHVKDIHRVAAFYKNRRRTS